MGSFFWMRGKTNQIIPFIEKIKDEEQPFKSVDKFEKAKFFFSGEYFYF